MSDLNLATSNIHAITISSANVRKNAGVVFSVIKILNPKTKVNIIGKELDRYTY